MGACFSTSSLCFESHSLFTPPSPSAKVISLSGSLREYPIPVTVSQVLDAESSSSGFPNSYFLCNSDRLYYDDYIPALDLEDQLLANQIYFVLPTTKLQRRLAASDMAALAVKASAAIQNNASSGTKGEKHRRSKKARICPFLIIDPSVSDFDNMDSQIQLKKNSLEKPVPNFGSSRSGSVKRLQRYGSRKARMAVRSFRLRLSTIYEGTDL